MTAIGQELRLRSPGKINLVLRVLGVRPDGFHELDTTLVAIDREDELVLRLEPPEGVRIAIEGPFASSDVPADGSNLAARAGAAVLERSRGRGLAPRGLGLTLALRKNLPSQAGLGGGSSNAAAVLLGTSRLLGLDPGDPELRAVLSSLGSDCPFFLEARASGFARCLGRGEHVEPLPAPGTERAFAVIVPEFGCATARVYAALRPQDFSTRRGAGGGFRFEAPIDEARAQIQNDLEAAALRSHPELARVRADLDRIGAGHFRLCGSGSSFFGLFEDRTRAGEFLRERIIARKGRGYALRATFVARPRPGEVS